MKNYNELLAENLEWAKEAFEKIDKKMSVVTLRSRDKLADGADAEGRHKSTPADNWTSGFWGGLNAMLYNHTRNEEYLKTALRSEELLDTALASFKLMHHDVGFMWHILSGALYRITGNEASMNRNLHVAANLFSRFVPYDEAKGGFIRAWNDPWGDNRAQSWTIIDCLLNLPVLYWASEEMEDDRFAKIAKMHADTAMRDHLRPDGSVAHIVEHNRVTGELVATYGGQGYGEGSSWSRGQAWALYGFTLSYIHTNDERYLNAAKRAANYFIANCCDDWLPRVDFRAPSQPVMYDSSAGACAACGLIELAKRLPQNEGGMYMYAAINILKAMEKSFVDYDLETDVMLKYGTIAYFPDIDNSCVHTYMIYSDYFYTEAILKLIGEEFLPW